MDENSKKNPVDDDMPSSREIARSLISIAVCGVLGYVASLIFDWSLWWCIGIGLVIGWALPGFIEGAKEELATLNDDKDVKN